MTNLNLPLAEPPPPKRSLLWHIADGINHLVQKLILFAFYYVPVSLALLNPTLRRSDIRDVHAGSCLFESQRYAIYVLWQPGGDIPWYVRNLLEELKEQKVNVIAVLNHALSPAQHNVLEGLCAKILVRGNKGLDFGAYRDAVLDLTRDNKSVARLLLFNDSVYVFRKGLKQLVSDLLSHDYPVVAAYECWERLYHFQSFCIGIAGSVLYDPGVQTFWDRYRPVAIRRWRIDQGEVKFSQALRKAASRFKVVYSVNELLDALLTEEDWDSILRHREFVPRPLRHLFPGDEVLTALPQATPQQRELLLQRLKERLSDALMLRAQAHTGAFLFPKFLGSPLLKRDLVFRELFTVYEVERMLNDLGLDEYTQSITDEIRRRGTAAQLKGLARRKHILALTP